LPLATVESFDQTVNKIMEIIEEVRENDFYNTI
jgi:hypothetical protein